MCKLKLTAVGSVAMGSMAPSRAPAPADVVDICAEIVLAGHADCLLAAGCGTGSGMAVVQQIANERDPV